jgi:hypothetical protein
MHGFDVPELVDEATSEETNSAVVALRLITTAVLPVVVVPVNGEERVLVIHDKSVETILGSWRACWAAVGLVALEAIVIKSRRSDEFDILSK